ncbi:MAG: carbohydrate ABC transporter permease [Desulfobacterales bacterium]|nr:MAG: carbohydrate ABC transporter permease [Desulfobacterales bacterium]
MSAKKNILRALDRILESYMTVYIVLGIIFVVLLSPLVLMFLTAFKTPEETEMWPPTIIPADIDLNAFADVIFNSNIPLAILNSLIISLSTVAVVVVAATFTAYGFSRYKYRGSRFLSYSLLATRIIPPISLTIPFFAIFAGLGLINKKVTLIILNVYLNYPIVTWLLIDAFNRFPSQLIDSAKIDGATRNETFFYVVLPLTVTAIAAGAIITFLFTWNEFLYALTFTQTEESMPLTVGIFEFVGDEVVEWTRLCAVGVFASLPSIIFFIFAQRYVVQGLTAGAIKE